MIIVIPLTFWGLARYNDWKLGYVFLTGTQFGSGCKVIVCYTTTRSCDISTYDSHLNIILSGHYHLLYEWSCEFKTKLCGHNILWEYKHCTTDTFSHSSSPHKQFVTRSTVSKTFCGTCTPVCRCFIYAFTTHILICLAWLVIGTGLSVASVAKMLFPYNRWIRIKDLN